MNNFNDTAVFVKDTGGALVYANDAFAHLLRRPDASGLLGKRTTEFFPGDVGAQLRQEDADVLASGIPRVVDRKLACGDGKSRMFAFRKASVEIGGKKFLSCSAELAKSESNKDGVPVPEDVRARFFSAISHDVRTPLNAIVVYAQLLQSSQDAAQRQEAIVAIDKGARNLLTAIDGVMTLLNPSANTKAPTVETFNVTDATRQIAQSYLEAAAANHVGLRMTSGALPLVEFAGAAYKDILGRLLDNAVRHTTSGNIDIHTSYRDGVLSLTVKDSSRGMTPGQIAEVMDPNSANDQRMTPGSSTLCLIVVKRITEKLGGSFSIVSDGATGTTVTVVFRGVKTPDVAKKAEFVRTQKMHTMRIEDPFRYDKRILVVDDIPVNVRILSLLLKALGFKNVVTATSGEQALELVRSEKFNVVFSDLMMPGMDGRQLLREIHSTPGLERLPVYAVTADEFAPVSCAKDGFAGILLKPITKEMLKDVL